MNTGNGDWAGRRLTVVGAGVSGQGLAVLASRLGAKVFVTEQKSISGEARKLFEENGIACESGHTERAFLNADALLLSSGIPPCSEIVNEARRRGLPLIGELDFTIPCLRAKKLIAVTGSNGKSTVTALTGHMLKRAGWNVGVGGNLGTASSVFARSHENFDAVVLELSSFQLAWTERLFSSPSFSIAIVTNLAPDHIDWHGSYEAYVAAKAKILDLRAPDGWGIVQDRDVPALNAAHAERIITLSWQREPEHKMAGHIFMDTDRAVLTLKENENKDNGTCLFHYSETTLLGSHNLENVAMSLAALRLLDIEGPASGLLEGFRPLPHRCENAGTVNGVLYVDDSKGTNVAASVTAMTSIKGRKVLILGGRGKGEDYTPLAENALREADAAVLIGEEANAIEKALIRSGFKPESIYKAKDMDEAVRTAYRLARPGMTVLLSPACTSWDMYDNYGQRGEHFCSLVRGLS